VVGRVMTGHRRMHARLDSSCPECGLLIRQGTMIHRFPGDKFFICQRCALLRSARAGNPAPGGQAETWADRMYAELPVTLADAAHKALVPVLHPDAGGSHDAMSALNRARDRAHGKNTKGQAA
jgi:hypothetical protein